MVPIRRPKLWLSLYQTISFRIKDPVRIPLMIKNGIKIKIYDTRNDPNSSGNLRYEIPIKMAARLNAEAV